MANKIDLLVDSYKQVVSLPWDENLAGAQRVWFAVYDKADERRLRYRLDDFETATKSAGHAWHVVDVTDAFGDWMGSLDYREEYFSAPEQIERLLPELQAAVVERVAATLRAVDPGAVVVVLGVACLFGLLKVSELVQWLAPSVRGRLLVLFPGEYEASNYRLLDARDGWNYLAVPITAHEIGAHT